MTPVQIAEQIEAELTSASAPRWRMRLLPLLHPAVCCLIVLACILVSNPFAKAGFDDAWTYSHLAFKFAQTGRVIYDGYASATALPQTIWGAAWIRLFGFSFDILRVATIPFSLGIVCLVFALGRQAGLSQIHSSFAALTIGTSPLFLPLAASFMTDIFGCFFFLLCVYSAISAAEAADQHSPLRWLWILALSGICGGSDRQIVWFAPLVLILYLGWKWRSRRHLLVHSALAFLCVCGSLLFVIREFPQPYAPLQMTALQFVAFAADHLQPGGARLIGLVVVCLTVVFPVLLCSLTQLRKVSGASLLLTLFASFAFVAVLVLAFGQVPVVPAVPGILSPTGVVGRGMDSLGFRPTMLPGHTRFLLTVSIIFFAFTFVIVRRRVSSTLAPATRDIFWLCALPYAALLVPGALMSLTFDRYVLPLTALWAITILKNLGPELKSKLLVPGAALLLLAAFGIAVTHDYASAQRARIQTAETLQARGISRSHISAGLEFDGWTQLELTGRMRMRFEGSYEYNSVNRFWIWTFFTAVQPDYVVLNARSSDTSEADLVTVPFSNWLPPFRRKAIARRRGDLPAGKICRNTVPCTEDLGY